MLENHPWFQIAILTGSERSIGRPYGEVVRWVLDGTPPASVAKMIVQPTTQAGGVPLAISALPADQAREAEPAWASAGTVVCSNASAFRMDPLVPLIIPEVNPEHVALIEAQRNARGWSGAIVTNPNCSTITLVMALKPLYERFGITDVLATTLQAISGAGYPGVASLDILDNVVPYIGGEEEKIETEPLKLLGAFAGDHIDFAKITVSASVNRVPVLDGHLVSTSIRLRDHASIEEVIAAMREFQPSGVRARTANGTTAPHRRARRAGPATATPRPRPVQRYGNNCWTCAAVSTARLQVLGAITQHDPWSGRWRDPQRRITGCGRHHSVGTVLAGLFLSTVCCSVARRGSTTNTMK